MWRGVLALVFLPAALLAGSAALAAPDPGRRVVGALAALRHQMHWKAEQAGFPSYLPSNNTFLRWIGGRIERLPPHAAINCWEAVLAAAVQANVLSKAQVAGVYLTAGRRGERTFLSAFSPEDRGKARGAAKEWGFGLLTAFPHTEPPAEAGYAAYTRNVLGLFGDLDQARTVPLSALARRRLRAGDLVVYMDGDTVGHVALAMGKKTREGWPKVMHLIGLPGEKVSRLRVSHSNFSTGDNTKVKVLRPRWDKLAQQRAEVPASLRDRLRDKLRQSVAARYQRARRQALAR